MSLSYRIATVAGIPIKLHISLLIVVFFLVHQFGWKHGLQLELGLAVSIILHELGHSLVALRKGCKVREISLLFIGGVAQMEQVPTRAWDEFLMAVAGPAVSLGLAILGFFLGDSLSFSPFAIHPRGNVLTYLGAVNLSLVIFNLLPAFPMDGGRMLRAILQPKMGRVRATAVASRIGKLAALGMGIYGFFFRSHDWTLVAIAFFIYTAAGAEYRQTVVQEAIAAAEREAEEKRVVISPPPYDPESPPAKADVHRSDDDQNPFARNFRL